MVRRIASNDLGRMYSKATDRVYKGRTLEITGKIRRIGQRNTGAIFLGLGPLRLAPDNVQCYFAEARRAQVVFLEKGQAVTLRGTYIGTGRYSDTATIVDCQIVSPLPSKPVVVPVAPDADDIVRTTALHLGQVYPKNSLVANRAYRGRTLEISGKICRIIQTGTAVELQGPARGFNVQCYDLPTASGGNTDLQVGQTVTLRGIGFGKAYYNETLDQVVEMVTFVNTRSGKVPLVEIVAIRYCQPLL